MTSQMQYVYPCVLTPEDEGGFFVSFPDVPEALTGGDNRAEALAMAEDALAAALGMYVKEREDIPVPSIAVAGQALVAVPTIVAAKLALYTAMRRQSISKVALAERLGLSEGAVRKLCDPDHRSHIGTVEDALRAVGRSLVLGDRAVLESPPPRATDEVVAPSPYDL